MTSVNKSNSIMTCTSPNLDTKNLLSTSVDSDYLQLESINVFVINDIMNPQNVQLV